MHNPPKKKNEDRPGRDPKTQKKQFAPGEGEGGQGRAERRGAASSLVSKHPIEGSPAGFPGDPVKGGTTLVIRGRPWVNLGLGGAALRKTSGI